jgi:RimJ/RimL family protein N-acetyltransferase
MRSETPVNTIRIDAYHICLEPMVKAHQPLLQRWRNDPEISQHMLSQEEISAEQQSAWFNKTSHDPKQLHWLIRFRDQLIGATNVQSLLTGVAAHSASVLEPGLYIGEKAYQSNIIAFAPTLAMYDYCFKYMKTKSFRAVVKSTNRAAIHYNKKLGYEVKEQGELCVLELNQQAYEQSSQQLKQFLSRGSKKR